MAFYSLRALNYYWSLSIMHSADFEQAEAACSVLICLLIGAAAGPLLTAVISFLGALAATVPLAFSRSVPAHCQWVFIMQRGLTITACDAGSLSTTLHLPCRRAQGSLKASATSDTAGKLMLDTQNDVSARIAPLLSSF